ncbi:MAG: DNA replication/repair protein RecF [Alphaproteobacteria bacterium]|nr:DNA replication/repair protein RecF [Alphaproteobacteria bacterium]
MSEHQGADRSTQPGLSRLGLRDFRNYAELQLKLDGRHVVLFGPNGAGKTNILEAVSFLSAGKGLRGADSGEAARHGASGGWGISADVLRGGVRQRLFMALEGAETGRFRKVVKLDGHPASHGDFADLVRVIWLTPAMDRVFGGSAGDRRRFFDRLVLAQFPAHGAAASIYERSMRERNAVLEPERRDEGWLEALEGRMADAGAAMAEFRCRAAVRLQAAIDLRVGAEFPKADVQLIGEWEGLIARGDPRHRVEEGIRQALRSSRVRDAAAGRTLRGVHRTDWKVIHRPTGAPAEECSTGQQKALLIGLILANARSLFEGDFGPDPLLLIDEGAAHLDSHRRAALYDELAALGGQAWLTGTDRELFDAFGTRAQRFLVSEGTVREI